MVEKPTLTIMVEENAIELIPNHSFRKQSLDLQEQVYFEIWTALKPL